MLDLKGCSFYRLFSTLRSQTERSKAQGTYTKPNLSQPIQAVAQPNIAGSCSKIW